MIIVIISSIIVIGEFLLSHSPSLNTLFGLLTLYPNRSMARFLSNYKVVFTGTFLEAIVFLVDPYSGQ